MEKTRHYENVHILLWLIKDVCWMMEWRIPGTIMILPTMCVALIIAFLTYTDKSDEIWIQLAICFWIGANSFWMLCEFTGHPEMKNMAGFPFGVGLLCVGYFYFSRLRAKRNFL